MEIWLANWIFEFKPDKNGQKKEFAVKDVVTPKLPLSDLLTISNGLHYKRAIKGLKKALLSKLQDSNRKDIKNVKRIEAVKLIGHSN